MRQAVNTGRYMNGHILQEDTERNKCLHLLVPYRSYTLYQIPRAVIICTVKKPRDASDGKRMHPRGGTNERMNE